MFDFTDETPLVPRVVGLTLANFQHLALLILVGPAVIQAVADVRAGRRPSVRRAYGVAFAKLGAVALAGLRALATVLVLALTVIGLPWAIAWGVRWAFAGQAVVLDGADAGRALALSASTVAGHWWRTLGVLAVLVFVAAVLGPLIGIPLMILLHAPLTLVNGVGGVIYAFTHPFAVVGGTLLYERLRGTKT